MIRIEIIVILSNILPPVNFYHKVYWLSEACYILEYVNNLGQADLAVFVDISA